MLWSNKWWTKKYGLSDSEENRLALKISFVAFIGLLLCIWFLIFLNGLYLQQTEKNDFLSDIQFFLTSLEEEDGDGDTSFYDLYVRDDFLSRFKKKELIHRLTRDILIIRKSWEIYRKWVFQFFDVKKSDIPASGLIVARQMDDRDFLLYEANISWDSVLFSRDITFIREFQEALTIIALILSLLFFLVIFWISLKIASYSLRPIKQSNERLKEYNHHVAHELKTPLAVLKSNFEIAQLSGDMEDILVSKSEIEWMEKIINALLFLSENTLIQDGEKIYLNDLFRKIISSYDGRKRIHFVDISKDVVIYKNQILVEQLIKNLIENAIKYSTWDTIFVELYKHSFTVANPIDANIPYETLQRIFQPFYKVDESRSTPWYGLWLSIVKRIVDIFDWKISVESKKKMFLIKVSF